MTQLRNQLLSHGTLMNGHGVGSLYLREYSEAGRIISVIFSVTFSKSSLTKCESPLRTEDKLCLSPYIVINS